MPITESDLTGVYDGDVLSASGEKIGSVGQIYLDDQSGEPTFITANTGLFGMSQSFVPLRGARVESNNVVVDFDKTTVKDAPRIDDDGSLSPAEEDQLYAYYGMGTAAADTADYGTADQTPEPGYATTDRHDGLTDDRHSVDQPGDAGVEPTVGAQDDTADRVEVADTSARSRPPVVETGTSGPVGRAEADPTTPDAPPAVGNRDDRDDRDDREDDGDLVPPATEESDGTARGGRLRKWVMTEYEPVKSEEVYVEGQGHPGERQTR